MRSKFSTFNIFANIFKMILQTILVFIVRIVFVRFLGEQYLGVQGLFTNVISMLSLTELGIGTAICYCLYEPLSKNDINKISQIMTLYKKVYFILGIGVTIVGLSLLPFIDYFVTSYSDNNLTVIYLLYLFNLSVSYFIGYKTILIEADQKNYLIAKYNIISIIITNILQLFVLYYTKNFILYLLSDFIINTIIKIFINNYITKKYDKVKFNCKKKLEKSYVKEIIKKVKSLLLFRTGNYLVDGTDNIIISKCINIATVGIYGNYLSITSIFKNFLNGFITGITSSFGNLIVEEDEKVQEDVFNIMNYITFAFFSYVSVCIINIFNPFIQYFYGNNYVLGFNMVLVIVLNFYISGMIYPLDSVKSAAGLYIVDKYIPIIQAFINLTFSIILVIKIGLIGVFLGTTISYLLVTAWNRPYVVYKYIFKSSVAKYFIKYLKEFFLTIVSATISYIILNKLSLNITLLNIIVTGIICTIIHLTILLIYSYNKYEFKYILNFIKKRGAIQK